MKNGPNREQKQTFIYGAPVSQSHLLAAFLAILQIQKSKNNRQ